MMLRGLKSEVAYRRDEGGRRARGALERRAAAADAAREER